MSLALDALAEGDRALVVLRFKNGLDYDELATAFGLRSGTVRMRVSRALARMREVLDATPARGRAPEPSFGAAPAPAPAAPRPHAPMPGGMGAPMPPAAAAVGPSWWQRLVAWGRGPAPVRPSPIGDVGHVLAMREPATPSEALLARLGGVVERMCP